MQLTLQDVVSHPAHKRFIMTKTRAEIEHMRDILFVLQKCDKVLELYRTYKLKDIAPDGRKKDFTHFEQCPWSDADCSEGPDTCICCYVSAYCHEIIETLNQRFPIQEKEDEC